jgi:hypothetical protein
MLIIRPFIAGAKIEKESEKEPAASFIPPIGELNIKTTLIRSKAINTHALATLLSIQLSFSFQFFYFGSNFSTHK